MPPKVNPTAAAVAPFGERLARIETLLESVAERQHEQHAENQKRFEKNESETREHRHRTANAMQEVMGRLVRIDSASASQAATISDILDNQAPAAATDRKDLRTRLETLEAIVAGFKTSWKILGALAAIAGGAATALGWLLHVFLGSKS